MKLTGEQLSGYTKSELYEIMMSRKCPYEINKNLSNYFTYRDCMISNRWDCLTCFKVNLEKEYVVDVWLHINGLELIYVVPVWFYQRSIN